MKTQRRLDSIHDRIGDLQTLCACIRGIRMPALVPVLTAIPLAAASYKSPLLAGLYMAGGATMSTACVVYSFVSFRRILQNSSSLQGAAFDHCLKREHDTTYAVLRPGFRKAESYLARCIDDTVSVTEE